MYLQKENGMEWWKSVAQGEPEIDTTKVSVGCNFVFWPNLFDEDDKFNFLAFVPNKSDERKFHSLAELIMVCH